ncbi:hypothetical protein EDB87DRAFT_1731437 [Lactarius vividus]|nr:hypothetical protein EDB87DRAFT_1731437 [Lactarius vividus]
MSEHLSMFVTLLPLLFCHHLLGLMGTSSLDFLCSIVIDLLAQPSYLSRDYTQITAGAYIRLYPNLSAISSDEQTTWTSSPMLRARTALITRFLRLVCEPRANLMATQRHPLATACTSTFGIRGLISPQWTMEEWEPAIARLFADQHTNDDDPNVRSLASNSLRTARRLDVDAATPRLQKEFCDLWNQLVVATQVRCQDSVLSSNVMLILSFICPIYIPLHKGTESQSSAFSASTNDLDPVLREPSPYS